VNFHGLPAGAKHQGESIAVQGKLAWQVAAWSSSSWHEALLITQRSQVQILPPLPSSRSARCTFLADRGRFRVRMASDQDRLWSSAGGADRARWCPGPSTLQHLCAVAQSAACAPGGARRV